MLFFLAKIYIVLKSVLNYYTTLYTADYILVEIIFFQTFFLRQLRNVSFIDMYTYIYRVGHFN